MVATNYAAGNPKPVMEKHRKKRAVVCEDASLQRGEGSHSQFFPRSIGATGGYCGKEKKKGQYFVGGWRVIVRMTQGTHELPEEALFLILCHALANRTLNIARAFWCGDPPYPRPLSTLPYPRSAQRGTVATAVKGTPKL